MADRGLRARDVARRDVGAGGRPVRGAARAVALVALLLLLAGCGALARVEETQDALSDAGIRGAQVSFLTMNGTSTVRVGWEPASETSVEEEGRRAAEVVWRTAKIRVDRVSLEPAGAQARFATREQLVAEFGPRDPALDEHDLGLGWVLWALAAAAVVGVGLVVLIVVLVRRTKRRARAPYPYAPAGQWTTPAPPPNPDDPFAPPPS